MKTITLVPGDGIGPEVTAAARAVVDASGAAIAWEVAPAGMQVGRESGNPLPESVFESLERNRVALKGPTQTPFGDPYRVWRDVRAPGGDSVTRTYPSVTIALRREFELFANVGRHARGDRRIVARRREAPDTRQPDGRGPATAGPDDAAKCLSG